MYGYCDILDDGRQVIGLWQEDKLAIGNNILDFPWLLQVRAVLHPTNNMVYVVGKEQETGRCSIIREDGQVKFLTLSYSNQVISVSGNLIIVGVQITSTSIQRFYIDLDLNIVTSEITTIPLTSQGLLNIYPDGSYELTDPVDRNIDGHHVRFPCTFNGVTVAQGLDDGSGRPFLIKDGKSMYLAQGGAFEPFQSPNGKYWISRSNSPTILSGIIPNEIIEEPGIIPNIRPFNHPVNVVIFKDPEGTSGAASEVLVNFNNQVVNRPLFVVTDTLESEWLGPLQGIYTEGREEPIEETIKKAEERNTRVVYCFDSPDLPIVPSQLRPYDQFWMELYRVVGESLELALSRWLQNLDHLISIWPGDIGLVPMFYTQGGAPPNDIWPINEVIKGLNFLDYFVNKNERIKVVAPFSYQRANGIVAFTKLQVAWEQCKEATPGPATYLPIIIEPEFPVDLPTHPPQEPDMYYFIPEAARPLSNGQPMIVTSSLASVFETGGKNPYDFFWPIMNNIRPTNQDDYNVGFILGYEVLMSGLKGDIPFHNARMKIYQARIDKGASKGYGDGFMDVFRLFVENPNDVQKVIDRIGQ